MSSIQQQRLEERLMVLEEENKLLKMLNKIEGLENENKMIKMEKQIKFLLKMALTHPCSNRKHALISKTTTESIMGKNLIKLESDIEEHIKI